MQSLESGIKRLIVEALALEDIAPQEIDSEAPLFVDGLGLDSIDALELAIVIHEKFGVKTSAEDERNRERFGSVKTLAAFVASEAAPERIEAVLSALENEGVISADAAISGEEDAAP